MSRPLFATAVLALAGFLTASRFAAAQDAPAPAKAIAAPTKQAAKPPAAAETKAAPSQTTEKVADEKAAAQQEKLEKAFAETMSGATLCGFFTAGSLSDAPCKDVKPGDGKPYGEKTPADKGAPEKANPEKNAPEKGAGDDKKDAADAASGKGAKSGESSKPLKEDRYTLGRVQKMHGETWLIEARIQYGGHDVTVPLMLKVQWAGDTPVITLTDFNVPGLGTFTSRVLFFRGQYAGTWQHGDHGGELFGKVLPGAKQ